MSLPTREQVSRYLFTKDFGTAFHSVGFSLFFSLLRVYINYLLLLLLLLFIISSIITIIIIIIVTVVVTQHYSW